MYVPLDNDWNKEEPLWYAGFEAISVDELNLDNDIVRFDFQTDSIYSQSENFEVYVNIKNRTIKGEGSRKFRERILKVLDWYLKARNDDDFKELLS